MNDSRRNLPVIVALLCLVAVTSSFAVGCGESEETPLRSVSFDAKLADEGTFITDEGYNVELTSVDIAALDFVFTAGGDTHLRGESVELPSSNDASGLEFAYHPGHIQGGQVLGEYSGEHLIRVGDSANESNEASFNLSSVRYDAVNFGFWQSQDVGTTEAGGPASARLQGTVDIEGSPMPFDFIVALEGDDAVLGVPFDVEIPARGAVSVTFEVRPIDPFENDTMFDGIDFATLPLDDGTLVLDPDSASFNRVRNIVRSHDHYLFSYQVEE